MKQLCAILIALALPCLILAQGTIEKSYPIAGKSEVMLEFHWGDVEVVSWSGSEVKVEGTVLINGSPKAEVFEVDSKTSQNRLTITSDADFDGIEKVTTIVRPDGTKIYKNGGNTSLFQTIGDEEVDKVFIGRDVDAKFKVYIPQNVKLLMESTYGNIKLSEYFEGMDILSTYGSVDVILSELKDDPEMKIESTYSNVDLSLPENANAKLHIKSGYGSVYTDMDFETDVKGRSDGCEFGQDITGVLNKGTGSIALESGYSNVYLRQYKAQ